MADMITFLKQSLVHQEKLQNELLGTDWRNKITPDQIQIAQLCEICEFADAIGFKWWTPQHRDTKMALLELADFWHFYLVDLLLAKYDITKIAAVNPDRLLMPPNLYSAVISLARSVLGFQAEVIPWLIRHTVGLLNAELSEFQRLYYRKAQLNLERKRRGYQQNPDAKFVGGREDNELLLED